MELNIQINATICTCISVHFNNNEYKNAKLYNIMTTMEIKHSDNKIQVWYASGRSEGFSRDSRHSVSEEFRPRVTSPPLLPYHSASPYHLTSQTN